MGSELTLNQAEPFFSVTAVGSFKQKAGCPDYVYSSFEENQISRLCLNECYNPSNERNKIDRIEVIRITVTQDLDNLEKFIQDLSLIHI